MKNNHKSSSQYSQFKHLSLHRQMSGEAGVCGSRKRRRRSLVWACHDHEHCHGYPFHRGRGKNALFVCTLMYYLRYCMALMSIPCSSNRLTTVATSGCLQFHRLPRAERISSSLGINPRNSVTARKSKIFQADDFDIEINEDEYSKPEAKVNVDDDDVIGADEYFGRFISEALKGNSADRSIPSDSKRSSSTSPSDENILLETKRMIEQQQQQIDLLMKLMNKQGRQPLPPQSVSSANIYENKIDGNHAALFPATSSTQQKPMIVPPLKAMLFIDGTWLYYSLNTRNPKHDALVAKYGKGWQNNYKVDW